MYQKKIRITSKTSDKALETILKNKKQLKFDIRNKWHNLKNKQQTVKTDPQRSNTIEIWY